jgi:hypothetical protein
MNLLLSVSDREVDNQKRTNLATHDRLGLCYGEPTHETPTSDTAAPQTEGPNAADYLDQVETIVANLSACIRAIESGSQKFDAAALAQSADDARAKLGYLGGQIRADLEAAVNGTFQP